MNFQAIAYHFDHFTSEKNPDRIKTLTAIVAEDFSPSDEHEHPQ